MVLVFVWEEIRLNLLPRLRRLSDRRNILSMDLDTPPAACNTTLPTRTLSFDDPSNVVYRNPHPIPPYPSTFLAQNEHTPRDAYSNPTLLRSQIPPHRYSNSIRRAISPRVDLAIHIPDQINATCVAPSRSESEYSSCRSKSQNLRFRSMMSIIHTCDGFPSSCLTPWNITIRC